MRDRRYGSVRPSLALLALLASLLLLGPALPLTFLTLLLASAAGEAIDKALSLVGYSTQSVAHSLRGLSGPVGYLACGPLHSSALLLLRTP